MKSPAADFDRYLARPTRRRLERVVRRYHGLVWKAAWRVTRHVEDAEDVCQDVFLKLLLEPPAPGSVKHPERYLVWQVLGRASNLRRSRERRQARETSHGQAPHSDVLPLDEIEALQNAVEALPDELRAPIELRYLGGLSTAETASALGIAERTVEDRLRRAREVLRSRLAPISAGALTFVSLLDGFADASPPAHLLGNLLRIGRMGSALAAGTASAGAAGISAGKPALIAGAALLLVATGTVGWKGLPELGEEHRLDLARANVPLDARQAEPAAENARGELETSSSAATGAPSVPARITGVVRDEDDAPVAGALVRISRWEKDGGGDALETSSDDQGEFTVILPAPGRWAARASKEGFLFPCGEYRMGSRAGSEENLSLRVCRPRRLFGTLLDTSGTAIPGAALWVPGEAAPGLDRVQEGELQLGEHGESWVRIPAGKDGSFDTGFRLAVMGVTDPAEFHAVAEGFAIVLRCLRRLDFAEGEARLDFILEHEMPIVVVVVDSAGKPIEGAEVGVGSKDSWRYRSGAFRARTDRLGRARLHRLAPAAYEVRAVKDGHEPGTALVSPGASIDVLLTLRPLGPGVRGRITFEPEFPEDSRGVGDIVFEGVEEGGEMRRLHRPRGDIDRDTKEFLYWPDPGRYRLRFDLHLLTWTTEPFEYTGREEVRADIHVGVEPPYLAGRVVRAGTDEPVPGVRVLASFLEPGKDHRSSWQNYTSVNDFLFTDPPGNKRTTTTNAEGKFLLILPRRHSGRETTVSTGESVVALLVGSKETGWAQDVVVDFDASTLIEDVRIELQPPGSVEGIVTEGGDPANRALIVASDFQGTTLWTQSDREGRYRIDGLRAGRYLVLPLGSVEPEIGGGGGGSPDMHEVPPPHELFDRPVSVNPGEDSRADLDLERDRPGSVEGTIAGDLQGAWVSYGLLVNGVPRYLHPLARGDRYARHGSFAADFLLPGRYRASLLTDFAGEQLAEADFDARAGHVARVHLEPPRGVLVLPVRAGGSSPEDLRVCRVERLLPGGKVERWRPFFRLEDRGRIRLERLPEGSITIVVAARGHVARGTDPIAIVPGQETLHPALDLEPGEEIRVRVSTAAPVIAVKKLEFHVRERTDGPGIEHTSQCQAAAEEQVCVLSAFAPGRYHLEVKAEEPFAPVHVPVEVLHGTTTDVQVLLRARE